MASDANRGHRRVVPSPDPLEIVELEVIRTLAEQNTVVIACGGGGIPVVRRGNRLAGIDAVIDKDRASALLARGLEAERLLILTEAPAVYRRFGEPDQEVIRELSGAEAETLLPDLAEGSMRPKVEAALSFGGETLITSIDALGTALAGNAGTRIHL
jgi:carbamate kinase